MGGFELGEVNDPGTNEKSRSVLFSAMALPSFHSQPRVNAEHGKSMRRAAESSPPWTLGLGFSDVKCGIDHVAHQSAVMKPLIKR